MLLTVTDGPKTKEAWVKHIYTKDWGDIRTRIGLRKMEGRESTEGEGVELGTPAQEEVVLAEIRQAFDNGEEVSSGHWPTYNKLLN